LGDSQLPYVTVFLAVFRAGKMHPSVPLETGGAFILVGCGDHTVSLQEDHFTKAHGPLRGLNRDEPRQA
jgi:hypothetical protein